MSKSLDIYFKVWHNVNIILRNRIKLNLKVVGEFMNNYQTGNIKLEKLAKENSAFQNCQPDMSDVNFEDRQKQHS